MDHVTTTKATPWISIHVPREGHDGRSSTRRACCGNFNPRAPRGARLIIKDNAASTHVISIHVPREGHDQRVSVCHIQKLDFNPRAPRGARPNMSLREFLQKMISIHVPREGHDTLAQPPFFYNYIFQSTCPARGTTRGCIAATYQNFGFQSTCPARGTTNKTSQSSSSGSDFNPRAPRGARLHLV